ncbi:DUF2905 domain-containing protein [Candidatus Parcubacteria bacterium]|nr:DUF2905 domain-containing protein [Candidatus Parcubacteria bacterium]
MNESKMLAGIVIISGVVLVLFGIILLAIGKLPGDIVIRKGNMTFFFPIVTSILLSIALTAIIYLLSRR